MQLECLEEAVEIAMKMIRSFVFVGVAAVCAACATQPPRTVSALPQPPTARQILQPLAKSPSGDYPGYQRIVVDGQTRYCRQNPTTDPETGSRVVCLTDAQLRTEHLLAQQQLRLQEAQSRQDWTRSPTPNLDSQAAAVQLQQSAANLPSYVGPR